MVARLAVGVCQHCGATPRPDHVDLVKRTYLTVEQLVDYLGFTKAKTRHFLWRNPTVRRVREGKYLLVWRRDVDEVLTRKAEAQERRRTA